MVDDGKSTWRVLDWLEAFVERRSVTPEQAHLLSLAIDDGRRQAAVLRCGLPSCEIPLAVYAAAGGAVPTPLPLAAACLCVYMGADILDNIADRELPACWATAGPSQAALVGIGLISPLASAALAELKASAVARLVLNDALVDGLISMGAGQMADLSFERRDDITLDECEAMILGKSGAEWSLFSRLGAILAEAEPSVCDAFASFGQELGATSQLISDCADLVDDSGGRDFATDKRTLPIVYALSTLSDVPRAALLGHLASAPHDAGRKQAARQTLLDAGAFHYGALAAEVHRQRALTALRSAQPAGPAAGQLYDLVESFAIGSNSPDH